MKDVLTRYAFLLQTQSGDNLIYVSRSNGFYKVDDRIYKALEELVNNNNTRLLKELSEDSLNFLRKRKILVNKNEDDDYLLELELKSNIITYSTQSLGLVVAPTTSCNFACSYCFEENKGSKRMSDQTIDDLLEFIKEHVNTKYLNLVWYGGEPLLAFDLIKKILPRIKKELPIELNIHQIITNGYYFDKQVIDFFKEYPLDLIQITLDGNEERHDSIRCLKGSGKGTYSKIIKNIDLIVRELPDVRVSLRINLDKHNQEEFVIIYKNLKARWDSNKVEIYPGVLRLDNEERTCLSCNAMSHRDIRDFYYSLHNKENLKVNFYPRIRPKSCTATCLNAYVIGPEGELYKCWNDVSDPAKVIGYINRKEFVNKNLLARYLVACNCLRNQECRNCFFLPICIGGCAWYKLRNLYEHGEFEMCSLYKDEYALKKCLLLHYESLLT